MKYIIYQLDQFYPLFNSLEFYCDFNFTTTNKSDPDILKFNTLKSAKKFIKTILHPPKTIIIHKI